ncbi:MAG: hypothetical protein ACRCV1_01465, partial [Leuconostoc mesenteroides]
MAVNVFIVHQLGKMILKVIPTILFLYPIHNHLSKPSWYIYSFGQNSLEINCDCDQCAICIMHRVFIFVERSKPNQSLRFGCL